MKDEPHNLTTLRYWLTFVIVAWFMFLAFATTASLGRIDKRLTTIKSIVQEGASPLEARCATDDDFDYTEAALCTAVAINAKTKEGK